MEYFLVSAAALLFLWSLLTICPAGKFLVFLFAVVATTYGNIMAGVSLLVLAGSWACSSWPAVILAAIATGLFLSPEIRATAWKRRERFPETKWHREPGAVLERKIEFGDGLRAECFFTESKELRPLLLVVHGGGWVTGDPRECVGNLRELARMGLFVASVSYRFAPAAQWPGQREDVLLGLREILGRSAELGIDESKVWLLGRSAGGQIASAVACAEEAGVISGCICLYAPFDMVFAYEHGKEDDMLRSPQLLRQYLGGPLEAQSENYHSASAFHLVTTKSPPFLLLHGTRDELVWIRQSRRLAQKIHDLGGQCRFLEFPWATHAFDHNVGGPAARITLAAIRKFIFE